MNTRYFENPKIITLTLFSLTLLIYLFRSSPTTTATDDENGVMTESFTVGNDFLTKTHQSPLFTTGPFQLVAEEGKSKCSWVNLDDVSSNYVRDLEKSHHQRVSELQRLRSIFGITQLQDTYILQGDYDLKVMRQEYYINRQKAFINHLINLLARHQLLKIACQLKRSTCSEVLIICLSLLSLSCNHTCLQQRVEWYSFLLFSIALFL
ncbi:hypothetical protein P8452_56359 [Trifolium repens]|nr:hypothetical protein P8452_56359 [Trifolium repens]